jgi:hypothetical protein
MKLRFLSTALMSALLLSGVPLASGAQTQAVVQKEGIYFVAYRTQSHIKYSSPDVFHTVASDLIAYLKSCDVNIIEDPERGILQTDESFSTESLLNLTKNAGASSLLLVTVERPATKWLKVTVEAYDLPGENLWTEEASSGGGISGGGAPAKVLKTLKKKLSPRVGKPGLPKQQTGSAAQRDVLSGPRAVRINAWRATDDNL